MTNRYLNLYDTLDNYVTNPELEISKISAILDRVKNVSVLETISFRSALNETYMTSVFGSYELDINQFINRVVLKGFMPNQKTTHVVPYRKLCEFLLELLETGVPAKYKKLFANDEKQLLSLITVGLKSCGYEIINYQDHRVTKKIDIVAEAVASTNIDYKEYIFDYLLSKSLDEKEDALTSLCIKLEATKSNDKYVKRIREYIQLLRHKEEKKSDKKYRWFFDSYDYDNNLDKLFRLLLLSIVHENSSKLLVEFDLKCSTKDK